MKKAIISIVVVIAVAVCGWTGYGYVKNRIEGYVMKSIGGLAENNPELMETLKAVNEQENIEQSENTVQEATSATATPVPLTPGIKKIKKNGSATGSKTVTTPTPTPTAEPTPAAKSSDELTTADRDKAVSNAYSRFSAAEIKKYTAMVKDGITAEEKAILKSVAYSKFSAEEIAYYYKIYQKFYK